MGLKGVQPRAADTTATVCAYLSSIQKLLYSYYLLTCFSYWCLVFQGPLFQQRPYPSPGAVLRKNAEIASQKKKPNSHFMAISKRGDGSDGLGDAD